LTIALQPTSEIIVMSALLRIARTLRRTLLQAVPTILGIIILNCDGR
jgi:hypothetical protein